MAVVMYRTEDKQIGTEVELIHLPAREFKEKLNKIIENQPNIRDVLIPKSLLVWIGKGLYIPPITIAEIDKKWFVIDGRKRAMALFLNKEAVKEEVVIELWKDIDFEKLFKLLVRLGHKKFMDFTGLLAELLKRELNLDIPVQVLKRAILYAIMKRVINEETALTSTYSAKDIPLLIFNIELEGVDNYPKRLKKIINNAYKLSEDFNCKFREEIFLGFVIALSKFKDEVVKIALNEKDKENFCHYLNRFKAGRYRKQIKYAEKFLEELALNCFTVDNGIFERVYTEVR